VLGKVTRATILVPSDHIAVLAAGNAVNVSITVYVTDRDNQRIQVFDSNGKFLEEWEGVGGISTLYMTADQKIWAGGVLRSLDGTVAAMLPGDVGGHGTTVAPDGSVFIAQLSGVVQKFEPVL